MITCLQINLNRCRAAHDALSLIVRDRRIDVCIISEANEAISKKMESRDQGWIADESADTAIWWTGQDKTNRIKEKGTTKGYTWVTLTDGSLVASCYFSPNKPQAEFELYLEEIATHLKSCRTRSRLVAGDFNASSLSWGGKATDKRGVELEEWSARHDLHVANDGDVPTFRRGHQEAFIDITLCDPACLVSEWAVLEEDNESMSDHQYIEYKVETGRSVEPHKTFLGWKGNSLNKKRRSYTKKWTPNVRSC